MLKLSKKQENTAIIGWLAIVGIIAFVLVFFMTQLALSEWDKAREYQKAYGIELPSSYQYTLSVTQDAANQTIGTEIDLYVADIKSQICPTLNTTKAIQDCFAI